MAIGDVDPSQCIHRHAERGVFLDMLLQNDMNKMHRPEFQRLMKHNLNQGNHFYHKYRQMINNCGEWSKIIKTVRFYVKRKKEVFSLNPFAIK